jgi:hypothetical protein
MYKLYKFEYGYAVEAGSYVCYIRIDLCSSKMEIEAELMLHTPMENSIAYNFGLGDRIDADHEDVIYFGRQELLSEKWLSTVRLLNNSGYYNLMPMKKDGTSDYKEHN